MCHSFSPILTAALAQSVERWTFNPTVAGSSPVGGGLFANPLTSVCLLTRTWRGEQQPGQTCSGRSEEDAWPGGSSAQGGES